MATIHETLQGLPDEDFTAAAAKLVKAAGLTMPDANGADRKLLQTRIAAQRPETTWLEAGENIGDGVERHTAKGRWTTAITLFYDRPRLAVIEHHVRGAEGDYDHTAWASAKRFPTAAKADVAWARLAKKYKIDAGVALPPAPKPKVAKAVGGEDKLFAAWFEKADNATLQVLADLWADHGDPRGELVQLSLVKDPTAEQTERRAALIKKHGGALVGPARAFLREWEFGANGIVDRARTEADKLVEGIAEITRLNPRLCMLVTSMKTQKQITAFSKISLAPLYYAGFTMGLLGSMGGTNLSDKALTGIAPAFRGLARFGLQARGFQPDCFTPAGLQAFADQLAPGVELILLDHYTSEERTPLPPIEDYLAVLNKHPNTKGAKVETDYTKLRQRLQV